MVFFEVVPDAGNSKTHAGKVFVIDTSPVIARNYKIMQELRSRTNGCLEKSKGMGKCPEKTNDGILEILKQNVYDLFN